MFRKTSIKNHARIAGLISTLMLLTTGCSSLSPEDRIVARDFGLASAAFTGWGAAKWQWFEKSPHMSTEGWFGRDTATGGSDKLGHMYTSYLLSESMIWDFRRNNVPNAEAKAALAALGAMTVIEIGDSTSSKHGFSAEDLTMDALGAGASWLLAKNPELDKKVDLRIEYWPSKGFSGKADLAADYSGMKHLIAIKGDGFNSLKGTPLEYLELQAGYYTRGYRSYDKGHYEKERNSYLGVGLNIEKIVGKDKPFAGVFEYYQVPGTYVEAKHNHNK